MARCHNRVEVLDICHLGKQTGASIICANLQSRRIWSRDNAFNLAREELNPVVHCRVSLSLRDASAKSSESESKQYFRVKVPLVDMATN